MRIGLMLLCLTLLLGCRANAERVCLEQRFDRMAPVMNPADSTINTPQQIVGWESVYTCVRYASP